MIDQTPVRRPYDDLMVNTEYADAVAIVHPNGEIDLTNCDLLATSLAVIERDVVIDMTGVTFLDSSAVAVLVSERRRLEDAGWSVRVVNPNDEVRTVLRVVGLGAWIDD